jgi:hypothetical protein
LLSIIDKEIDDSINEQLKRFENLKQKLESPELQKQMTNNLDNLRRQSRLIHSDILKQLIDKMELLIIDDQGMINARGYKTSGSSPSLISFILCSATIPIFHNSSKTELKCWTYIGSLLVRRL